VATYVQRSLDLETLTLTSVEQGDVPGDKKKWEAATPGTPSCQFFSVSK
jgi:hypothetical protein